MTRKVPKSRFRSWAKALERIVVEAEEIQDVAKEDGLKLSNIKAVGEVRAGAVQALNAAESEIG